MFCIACRTQMIDPAKFCPECGTAAVRPVEATNTSVPRPTAPARSIAEARDLIRWGGILCAVAALLHCIDLFIDADAASKAGSLLIGAACAVVACLLWKRQPFGAAVAAFVLLGVQGVALAVLILGYTLQPGHALGGTAGSLLTVAALVVYCGWRVLKCALMVRKATAGAASSLS